jgi:hypothetical protein
MAQMCSVFNVLHHNDWIGGGFAWLQRTPGCARCEAEVRCSQRIAHSSNCGAHVPCRRGISHSKLNKVACQCSHRTAGVLRAKTVSEHNVQSREMSRAELAHVFIAIHTRGVGRKNRPSKYSKPHCGEIERPPLSPTTVSRRRGHHHGAGTLSLLPLSCLPPARRIANLATPPRRNFRGENQ